MFAFSSHSVRVYMSTGPFCRSSESDVYMWSVRVRFVSVFCFKISSCSLLNKRLCVLCAIGIYNPFRCIQLSFQPPEVNEYKICGNELSSQYDTISQFTHCRAACW